MPAKVKAVASRAKPKSNSSILVVDDELAIVQVLQALLTREGYAVVTASDGEEALAKLESQNFDLVISDISMPSMDGLTLLKELKRLQNDLEVILVTAYASVETAVEAKQQGAFDYVCKPFKVDQLLQTVDLAISSVARKRAKQKHKTKKLQPSEDAVDGETVKLHMSVSNSVVQVDYHFGCLVGETKSMQKVYSMIEKIARTNSPVLIVGESGTGKSLVAQVLHESGLRAEYSFAEVDCNALSNEDAERQLFGPPPMDEIGDPNKLCAFIRANGGTLFIQSIDALSLKAQSQLAEVLEKRQVQLFEGADPIDVDTRIIASCNSSLRERVKQGDFLKELYFRLSAIPVELPPLRERSSDVTLLVRHFFKKYQEKHNRALKIDDIALKALRSYDWPGNVRELEKVLSEAAEKIESDKITLKSLPQNIQKYAPGGSSNLTIKYKSVSPRGMALQSYLKSNEKEYIEYVLQQTKGDRQEAAKMLGMTLPVLEQRIQELFG